MRPNRPHLMSGLGQLCITTTVVAACLGAVHAEFPVKRAVLFNSGVGYFELAGEVAGNQSVDLDFSIDNVNDLLKSMVVQDLGGGKISMVSYEARKSIDEQLAVLAIDLRDMPTLGELLQQLRGERVRVAGSIPGEGTILGLEAHVSIADNNTVTSEVLNLHTENGLQSIPLGSVSSVQLLNEAMNNELQKALSILAHGRKTDRRNVTLRCEGKGKRIVRVGYVVPTPVWKTTYRLVVADGESALMQGWAIVENVSDFDWTDVTVSLVSGQPVSFAMDLYSPLFVQRQQLPVDVTGVPSSRIDDRIDSRQRRSSPRGKASGGGTFGGGFGGGGLGGGGFGGGLGDPTRTDADEADADFDPSQGVAAVGNGKEVGEYFRYDLRKPVTLPAGRSAMLPIVDETIETEKMSIYRAGVGQPHALHSLRLKNSTKVFLMAGPITVFEASNFAGDARIRDMPPGRDRLISYAVDQEVKVDRHVEVSEPEVVSSRLTQGVLHIRRDDVRTYQYTIDYTGTDKRRLMIEHPRPDGPWHVVKPEVTEETESHLRFVLDLAPHKAADMTIIERWRVSEDVKLSKLKSPAIADIVKLPAVDDGTLNALTEYLRLKQLSFQLANSLGSLHSQVQTIQTDQSRIRSNMKGLDRTSSLYERYVAKMDEQENTLDRLATEMLDVEKQVQDVKDGLAAIDGS